MEVRLLFNNIRIHPFLFPPTSFLSHPINPFLSFAFPLFCFFDLSRTNGRTTMLSPNYWGTTNATLMAEMIPSGVNDPSLPEMYLFSPPSLHPPPPFLPYPPSLSHPLPPFPLPRYSSPSQNTFLMLQVLVARLPPLLSSLLPSFAFLIPFLPSFPSCPSSHIPPSSLKLFDSEQYIFACF